MRGWRRNLWLAVALQTMISVGDGVAQIALASRVYEKSHAAWAVAVVFLAISVPIVVLAPAAGLLLDRLPPKRVLLVAAVVSAGVALAMVLVTGVPGTLGLAIGFGLCAAVLVPGLGSIVPRLAPADRITKANSLLQAATWSGLTLGPLLAGLLSAIGGTGLALAGNAVTYLIGAVGLAMLRLAPNGHEDDRNESMLNQVRAGLTYLRSDWVASLMVSVVAVMMAFGFMAVVAEVVLAEGVFHSGTGGYSALVASWGGGMIIGTLAGGRLSGRWLVPAAMAGTLVTGLGIASAGLGPTLWVSALSYGVGGLADGVQVLATRSYLNMHAPPAIAGRVFALYSAVMFGAASVGMATASGLLAGLGVRLVLVVAGSGGIVAAVVGSVILFRHRTPAAADQPASAATGGAS